MTRRLVRSLLLLVVVALVLFVVPVGLSLADLLRNNARDVAIREARTLAFLAGQDEARDALVALRSELEQTGGARVELIDVRGRPLLGRAVNAPTAADLTNAIKGRQTTRLVSSSVLDGPAVVVTTPVRATDGDTIGAVRLTYPTASVERQIRGVWLFRLGVGVVTMVLTAMLAVFIARWLTRPILELERAATRFGRGDLAVRAPETGPPEIRAVARAINDGAQRIEGLVTSQQRFVADASHQLRSPLTALRLSLDNAQDAVDDPEVRRALDGTIAEVVRMSRLTNGLLALARAQADSTAQELQRVDEIVQVRAEAWDAAARDRGIGLQVLADRPVQAFLSPGHLEQVLDNLIANALDLAPAGSCITLGTREIATRGERTRRVEVVVRDEGPGMTAEQRERAFDRFWRGRRGGTGLGLAIVRQLVEDNHGRVELHAAEGGGLLVQIELPSAGVPEL